MRICRGPPSGAALGLVLDVTLNDVRTLMLSSVTSPIFTELLFDWRGPGFTALTSAGTALPFGLVPALRAARVQPQSVSRKNGRGQAGGKQAGANQVLIVAQVILSLFFVVAPGLFVRTVATMATMPLGFDREFTLILSLKANDAKVLPATQPVLYERARQAAAAVPVESNAVAPSYADGEPRSLAGQRLLAAAGLLSRWLPTRQPAASIPYRHWDRARRFRQRHWLALTRRIFAKIAARQDFLLRPGLRVDAVLIIGEIAA